MDSNAAIPDIDLDEGSDRTPSPPHSTNSDDQVQEEPWDAAKVSESAATVRGMPEYVVEELERIQASRREAAPPPFVMPSETSYSYPSIPPSPRLTGADSSALGSPPSSPADSVSSLPSVGSSFFFSSAAASPRMALQPELAPKSQERPQMNRRRQTVRPEDESSLSSLESSPSSLELLTGADRRVRKPHRHGHYSDAAGATSGLVIPSLSLPPALKTPTPYGQTLGEVRLLVLARQGAKVGGGRGFVASLLLEGNDHVVEVGEWEDPAGEDEMELLGRAGAKVLRASTDWVEHADAHGLEKYEPSRNVEVCELPGYDALTDGTALVESLKNIVQAPFRAVAGVLHPDSQPSSVLANLVSSASTPLFTALVILLPSSLTPLDRHIIDSLGPHIPVVVLPSSTLSRASTSSSYPISSSSSFSSSSAPPSDHFQTHGPRTSDRTLVLSSFRPKDEVALKHGLFHSPETLATLRMEAAGRFLRWREVERVVRGLRGPSPQVLEPHATDRTKRSLSRMRRGERKGLGWRGWDKEKWEREWMSELSKDVAVGMKATQGNISEASPQLPTATEERTRSGTRSPVTPRSREEAHEEFDEKAGYEDEENAGDASVGMMSLTHSHAVDPLHLPSLLFFTVSMLGPLKSRVLEMVRRVVSMPFNIVFSPSSSASSSPTRARDGANYNYVSNDGNAAELSEKQRVRERPPSVDTELEQQKKWLAVSGLVGVGFCVGVGVGVVAARRADYASS